MTLHEFDNIQIPSLVVLDKKFTGNFSHHMLYFKEKSDALNGSIFLIDPDIVTIERITFSKEKWDQKFARRIVTYITGDVEVSKELRNMIITIFKYGGL